MEIMISDMMGGFPFVHTGSASMILGIQYRVSAEPLSISKFVSFSFFRPRQQEGKKANVVAIPAVRGKQHQPMTQQMSATPTSCEAAVVGELPPLPLKVSINRARSCNRLCCCPTVMRDNDSFSLALSKARSSPPSSSSSSSQAGSSE